MPCPLSAFNVGSTAGAEMVTAPVTGEGCEESRGKPGAGAPTAGSDEPNTKPTTKVERTSRARPTKSAQQPMVLLQLRKSTRSLGSYIPVLR